MAAPPIAGLLAEANVKLIGALAGLATIAGLGVKLRQQALDRAKLRSDEYHRRYAERLALRDRTIAFLCDLDDVTPDKLLSFWKETEQARYLCDSYVANYLEEVYRKALRLQLTQDILAAPCDFPDQDRGRVSDTGLALHNWLTATRCKEHFAPYLEDPQATGQLRRLRWWWRRRRESKLVRFPGNLFSYWRKYSLWMSVRVFLRRGPFFFANHVWEESLKHVKVIQSPWNK